MDSNRGSELRASSLRTFFVNVAALVVVILGAGSAVTAAQIKSHKHFLSCLARQHDQIWAPHLSEKAQAAKDEYEKKLRLPTGEIYGDSVRHLLVSGKTICQLEEEINQLGCNKHTSVLLDPTTKDPLKTPYGKIIPIWIYLCSDGGVVRIKPNGDLTSRYIPYPNVTKGVRHPYNSNFRSFDDEQVKIDDDGYAIPKWPADLNRDGACGLDWRDFVDGWAADAHGRIKPGC